MFASCVTVAGNLTDTPQLRFTATGTPVCNFQVAVAQSNRTARAAGRNTM